MKRLFFLISIPILVILFTVIIYRVTLGGVNETYFQKSSQSYLIAQTLKDTSGNSNLPIEGKDFSIKKVKYFDSGSWMVVSINSVSNSANSGLIVFSKQASGYVTILGPGTGFSSSDLARVPNDVSKYLQGGK